MYILQDDDVQTEMLEIYLPEFGMSVDGNDALRKVNLLSPNDVVGNIEILEDGSFTLYKGDRAGSQCESIRKPKLSKEKEGASPRAVMEPLNGSSLDLSGESRPELQEQSLTFCAEGTNERLCWIEAISQHVQSTQNCCGTGMFCGCKEDQGICHPLLQPVSTDTAEGSRPKTMGESLKKRHGNRSASAASRSGQYPLTRQITAAASPLPFTRLGSIQETSVSRPPKSLVRWLSLPSHFMEKTDDGISGRMHGDELLSRISDARSALHASIRSLPTFPFYLEEDQKLHPALKGLYSCLMIIYEVVEKDKGLRARLPAVSLPSINAPLQSPYVSEWFNSTKDRSASQLSSGARHRNHILKCGDSSGLGPAAVPSDDQDSELNDDVHKTMALDWLKAVAVFVYDTIKEVEQMALRSLSGIGSSSLVSIRDHHGIAGLNGAVQGMAIGTSWKSRGAHVALILGDIETQIQTTRRLMNRQCIAKGQEDTVGERMDARSGATARHARGSASQSSFPISACSSPSSVASPPVQTPSASSSVVDSWHSHVRGDGRASGTRGAALSYSWWSGKVSL